MLQTIEIEIDDIGKIHTLEPLPFKPTGRALLTLLDKPDYPPLLLQGSAKQALALLASERFARRPVASPDEVSGRISRMRNDWDQHP